MESTKENNQKITIMTPTSRNHPEHYTKSIQRHHQHTSRPNSTAEYQQIPSMIVTSLQHSGWRNKSNATDLLVYLFTKYKEDVLYHLRYHQMDQIHSVPQVPWIIFNEVTSLNSGDSYHSYIEKAGYYLHRSESTGTWSLLIGIFLWPKISFTLDKNCILFCDGEYPST